MNRERLNAALCRSFASASEFAPNAFFKARLKKRSFGTISSSDAVSAASCEGRDYLKSIIEQYRPIILDDRYEQLMNANIEYVRLNYCNAIADYDSRSIILFEGLKKVLEFRTQTSLIGNAILQQWNSECDSLFESKSEFQQIFFRAQFLSVNSLIEELDLPDLDVHLNESQRQHATVAVTTALLFILLHEVAHLVLNHQLITSDEVQFSPPFLAFAEKTDQYKMNEFEADQFAIESIVAAYRPAIIVGVWYAMSLYLDYESLAGRQDNFHPFSINRMSRLNVLSNAFSDPQISDSVKRIFDGRLKVFQNASNRFNDVSFEGVPSDIEEEIKASAILKGLDSVESCKDALKRVISCFQLIRS